MKSPSIEHIPSVLGLHLKHNFDFLNVSNIPIVGSFMVGNQIFDAEALFKSLRALGLNIEATPEGIIVNGVLIKPNATLAENVCPLTKICERRAYFLELIQKKTFTTNHSQNKEVNGELDLLFKTLDENARNQVMGDNDEKSFRLFGIKVEEEKDDSIDDLLIKNAQHNDFLTQELGSKKFNHFGSGPINRHGQIEDEIVKKALKQIFSPNSSKRIIDRIHPTPFKDRFPSQGGLTKPCPSCGELLSKEWDVCPNCGYIF